MRTRRERQAQRGRKRYDIAAQKERLHAPDGDPPTLIAMKMTSSYPTKCHNLLWLMGRRMQTSQDIALFLDEVQPLSRGTPCRKPCAQE